METQKYLEFLSNLFLFHGYQAYSCICCRSNKSVPPSGTTTHFLWFVSWVKMETFECFLQYLLLVQVHIVPGAFIAFGTSENKPWFVVQFNIQAVVSPGETHCWGDINSWGTKASQTSSQNMILLPGMEIKAFYFNTFIRKVLLWLL